MSNLSCHSGNLGTLGDFGIWGWIGLILNLIFWIGLLAGLTLLAIRAIRGTRVPTATAPYATGPSTDGLLPAKQILQAQYARGEITREEYELKKQDIG